MNPDPIAVAHLAAQHASVDRAERERRDALHRAAVARRRKRKNGGRK